LILLKAAIMLSSLTILFRKRNEISRRRFKFLRTAWSVVLILLLIVNSTISAFYLQSERHVLKEVELGALLRYKGELSTLLRYKG